MDIQTRKLNFIQEILALSNEEIIVKLEGMLMREKRKESNKSSVYDFVGIISESEADSMKKIIEDTCERINEEDWN